MRPAARRGVSRYLEVHDGFMSTRSLCATHSLCRCGARGGVHSRRVRGRRRRLRLSRVPGPGSDVQLRALGCTGTTGTAVSTAFVADARLTGQGGVLVGDTRVRSSATPGAYEVKVSCDGRQNRVSGTVTVTAPGGPTS